MKLSYEDHDRVSVITLSGELTNDQADKFRRAFQERFEAGVCDVVLDLRHLMLLDSSGLESLLWLRDEVGGHQGHLCLVAPDETIRTVLEITRLLRRFEVHASIESAAKSLRYRA